MSETPLTTRASGQDTPPADVLHIGAGEENPPNAVTLDAHDYGHTDYVHDVREPWPFSDGCFTRIVANHVIEHITDPLPVFQEAARCLRDDGRLRIAVPVGVDARADATHQDVWTWRTPLNYSRDAEPWQPGAAADLPLEVVERDLSLWSHWTVVWDRWPTGSGIVDYLANKCPIAAQDLPGVSGELVAVYRRCPR